MRWNVVMHPVVFVLAGLVALPPTSGRTEETPADAPTVSVVSPKGSGYLLPPYGAKTLIVSIEITDVSGHGINTSDAGTPRFVAPNRNVLLFLGHIVERSSFVNPLGQEVIQIVSRIPAGKLEISGLMRPPIDFRTIRPEEGEREFIVPLEEMVDYAGFHFRVADLRGVRSDPEAGALSIGLAPALWAPTKQEKPREEHPGSD